MNVLPVRAALAVGAAARRGPSCVRRSNPGSRP
jgi:hypothetical protein